MLDIQSRLKALGESYQRHYGLQEFSLVHDEVSTWFESPLGKNILNAEQAMLDQLMPEIFGYHLMQLSVCPQARLSEKSLATHHFSLFPGARESSSAIAHFEDLPIQNESLDAVLVHHSLEFSANPHQLLREVSRTLIPNGFIVIVGFNPLGILQARKQFGRFLTRAPQWRYRNLFRRRVLDWLKVLDFDIALKRNGFFYPPLSYPVKPRIEQMLGKLAPFSGAFYIIVARKSVVPLDLLKHNWKKSRSLSSWASKPVFSSELPPKKCMPKE